MRLIVLLLATFALVAAGCGGDDDNDGTAQPQAGSTGTQTQTTPAETETEGAETTETETEKQEDPEAVDPETGDYANPEEREAQGPTSSQFAQRGNRICRRGRQQTRRAQREAAKGGRDVGDLGALLEGQARIYRQTTNALAKLQVPEGGEAEVKELLRVRRLAAKYQQEAAQQISGGDRLQAAQGLQKSVRAQRKADRLANDIGLSRCAQA